MRKLFTTLLAAMFLLSVFIIPAFACKGPECEASASLGIGAAAGNIGVDADGKLIKNGAAGSIGVGAGGTAGISGGFVINGAAGANVNVIGGGASGAEAYKINLGVKKNGKNIKGLEGVKVGSGAGAVAQTGGSLDVSVDPAGNGLFSAGGLVAGTIGGAAGQGTLSGSIITNTKKFDSNGISVGAAGQGSTGSWSGSAHAESLGDYEKTSRTGTLWLKKNGKNAGKVFEKPFGWHPSPSKKNEWKFVGFAKDTKVVDNNAAAGLEANIHMYGSTYSESYRYIDTSVKGQKTEGFGSNVGADTHVTSYGSTYENSTKLANSNARVNGGFNAAGGATTLTAQESMGPGSFGGAIAGGFGSYSGSGDLGCNFDGSVVGSSYTSVTTFDGMNGSINSAGASMNVSATHNTNQPE